MFYPLQVEASKKASISTENSASEDLGTLRANKNNSIGVGDGNRTRNVRSHSPVLCQLSYSHRIS